MKIIGVTGGVGCGKSLATSYIEKKGYYVIDADLIVKDLFLIPDVQKIIEERFHTLNKRELRQMIYESADKRKQLENVLHPRVMEKVQSELSIRRKSSDNVVFVSIPLLFEKKLETMFDSIIAVSCSEKNQIERLMDRDKIDTSMAQAMIQSQWSSIEKSKKATYIIENDSSIESLHEQIDHVISKILAS